MGRSGKATAGPARVVTVSASYGSSGSLIAPAVAARLGLSFYDRLIPARAAVAAVGGDAGERLTDDERLAARRTSFLDRLAHLTGGLGLPVPAGGDIGDHVRETVERSIRDIGAESGGVILGRGAMIVLAGQPGAFHVRLDGPAERRCARAMAFDGIDERSARERMVETDRARARYLTRLYGRDAHDPALYHLVLDSTVLPVEACVRMLVDAALAFWAAE